MSLEWQGCTYDLLSRNCCHFCEVLVRELATAQPVPGEQLAACRAVRVRAAAHAPAGKSA
jgi:hypothetical protein